ncbi:peptidoglycan editing factor PgeF [Ideonella sp. B508-1]|uniref:peptidoglycan editing factor PgeF n=1 Tax=Ideonella sp. B508-1 TaxID=137716 RepID=UPI0003B6286C|nr:peptidoglycan editing factor PgeF [Ideonella sp. B508-1]
MPSERHPDWLVADGLPAQVRGLMATRAGGVSQGACQGLNLRPNELPRATEDDPDHIRENQRRFAAALDGAVPVYLNQVHGADAVRLHRADLPAAGEHPVADASFTTDRGVACTVLVADCLPVLLAAPDGRGVAAAHAGWRGLAGGVLERTVTALCEATACEPSELSAWLGACIGPERFEVGEEVRTAFLQQPSHTAERFRATGTAGKWWADLPGLARERLCHLGLHRVGGGQWCTVSEPSRFFSFRRDRDTGRHAAAIWIV